MNKLQILVLGAEFGRLWDLESVLDEGDVGRFVGGGGGGGQVEEEVVVTEHVARRRVVAV